MDDPRDSFIRESQWHGGLQQAAAILSANPGLATGDIHVAAILGDDATVRQFIAADPATATAPGGPFKRDPLTHLCFSRYLQHDPSRSAGFVRAATALLDAGASPVTGFYDSTHTPTPCFESVLYGAAGVAHHPGLTRLLLERGADPNDPPGYEVPYHAPEGYDNRALQVLVETGKLSPWSLSMMLIRKVDWHDEEGALYLLQHGADPEYTPEDGGGWRPLHHATARDNSIRMVGFLLDHGADPLREKDGATALEHAARRGRGDLLELFMSRDVPIKLSGVDALIAGCALHNDEAITSLGQLAPSLVQDLVRRGGQLIVEFAGNGNTGGVQRLVDLGVPVDARFAEGDGYWEVAPDTTALQNAAWRLHFDTVDLLVQRGADVNARNGKGQTALQLAIRACTTSYWSGRRNPRSIAQLLDAGADTREITLPTGYPEADALIRTRTG